jgi:hypothetical protein
MQGMKCHASLNGCSDIQCELSKRFRLLTKRQFFKIKKVITRNYHYGYFLIHWQSSKYSQSSYIINKRLQKKLHGLSPRANYTDRATTACRRSDCQLFADRGCYVIRVTDPYGRIPYGRILGFLDWSRYFSVK